MADTLVDSGLNIEQWADKEFVEYVRINPLKSLMGSDENSVIQVKEELTKKPGDQITFSLITRLTGTGTEDDNTLQGNEEQLGNHPCKVTVHQMRHGVVIGEFEEIKTNIDILNAARTMLRIWNMEQLRDLFIARLFSPCTDGTTTYAAATEVQKDAWEAANNPSTGNQRILFGSSKGNSSGDHSAGLTTIDGTADDAHQNVIRLAKRLAQSCSPHIRPVVVPGSADAVGGERFYALMGSLPFRDLQANFETVLSNADVRGDQNKIFTGSSIKVGNVICLEITELDRLSTDGGCLLENVGDGATTEVEPIFVCGAQALLLAWAARMSVRTDNWDYQNRRGVAVREIRGCRKSTFNDFQHGLVTNYVSAVGD